LPRSPVTDRHGPIFQNARLEPFLGQADDALIAHPMAYKADQPFLTDFVEERSDVGIQLPSTHLSAVDPKHRAHPTHHACGMLAGIHNENLEIFLADCVQQREHCPLDNLALQGSDPDWAFSAGRFRDVDPPVRRRSIRSVADPVGQGFELALEVCF
jgi:hypothetical protein